MNAAEIKYEGTFPVEARLHEAIIRKETLTVTGPPEIAAVNQVVLTRPLEFEVSALLDTFTARWGKYLLQFTAKDVESLVVNTDDNLIHIHILQSSLHQWDCFMNPTAVRLAREGDVKQVIDETGSYEVARSGAYTDTIWLRLANGSTVTVQSSQVMIRKDEIGPRTCVTFIILGTATK